MQVIGTASSFHNVSTPIPLIVCSELHIVEYKPVILALTGIHFDTGYHFQ